MDIAEAIERHRKPLLRIVARLFAMVGLTEGQAVDRLSLPVYRAVLRLLRPAESAVRRLIVVASRGLVLKPARQKTVKPPLPPVARKRHGRATFRLFDARPRFTSAFANERVRHRIRLVPRPEPRLRVIDTSFDPRVPLFRKMAPVEPAPAPEAHGTVNAKRLSRRLMAIKSALEDLPRQARRYLRWQAKPHDKRRPQFASALRPGTPPGYRKTPIHKVDEILGECDWLARQSRTSDTS